MYAKDSASIIAFFRISSLCREIRPTHSTKWPCHCGALDVTTGYISGKFLLNQLKIAKFPGLVIPGFQRSIHPVQQIEALFRQGLYPVVFLAFGRFGAEIYGYRTVTIFLQSVFVAVCCSLLEQLLVKPKAMRLT